MTRGHSMSYVAVVRTMERTESGRGMYGKHRQLMPKVRSLLVQDLHCEEEKPILGLCRFAPFSVTFCHDAHPHYQHKNTQDDWKVNMTAKKKKKKSLAGWSHAVVLSESKDYDGRHCPQGFQHKVNTR